LSDESKKIIGKFADFIDVPIEIRDFSLNEDLQTTDLNIQIYTRLLWLDTLEEKFLWLDADTLPLENWDEVFFLDEYGKSEATISAVVDKGIVENMPVQSRNMAYVAGDKLYFNAGIFLGNPSRWQSLGYDKVWREIGKVVEEYGFVHNEQDILNYILAEDKRMISEEYNAMVMPGSDIKQKILHYTGNPKPWHFDEIAKRYFISIETLKNYKTGMGAFGGANWVYEYQNYWRHEESLLALCQGNQNLVSDMAKLYANSRRELLDRKDRFKLMLMNATGKKWF
jgi:lipopolysaccharide biosynthesis glycosyltransferase